MKTALMVALSLAVFVPTVHAEEASPVPVGRSEVLGTFAIKDARQAVGVDADAFYAIDNTVIAKFEKASGKPLARWEGPAGGPIIHLDSAAVIDGRIYTAHSNYPEWPMTSSVEVWDAATLKHVESHSFGIDRGSLTWLDRDAKGQFWGGFANYNRVFDKSPLAYGNKYNTQVVRFDKDWRVVEAFVLPDNLVERFADMSNSGGSFGPDGKLYLTGHDNAELYVMELPEMGSVLRWTATIPLQIAGQGFAFDRSRPDVVYGIIRKTNQVTVNRIIPPGVN